MRELQDHLLALVEDSSSVGIDGGGGDGEDTKRRHISTQVVDVGGASFQDALEFSHRHVLRVIGQTRRA